LNAGTEIVTWEERDQEVLEVLRAGICFVMVSLGDEVDPRFVGIQSEQDGELRR
jgi:hypothetical protein